MAQGGFGKIMGLFRNFSLKNESVWKKFLHKFSRFLFSIEDYFANTNSLLVNYPNLNLNSRPSPIILYATHGNDSQVLTLQKYFCDQLIVIQNLDSILQLSSIQENTLYRFNRGFDLGAFRDSLNFIFNQNYNQDVVLINSSVYWDLPQLKHCIDDIQRNCANQITFLTKSYQGVDHCQTFFIYVPRALLSGFISIINKRWKNWRFKRSTVHFGEQDFYGYLHKENFQVGSFYDSTLFFDLNYLKNCNPTLDLNIVNKMNYCFEKKSLRILRN